MTKRHDLTTSLVRCSLFILLLGVAAAVGCRSNTSELVERENHQLEIALREAHHEIHRTQAYSDSLQRELSAIRIAPVPERVTPEMASQTYTLKSITLGRQTGGVNNDSEPGDEALQVVIEPRDVDGHVIKTPGSLMIQAMEITRDGVKTPLCSWTVSQDDLRRNWDSRLFSTGYFLTLGWRHWPNTDKLRVNVQFILPDGRMFEADKDVMVKLAPLAGKKTFAPPPTLEVPDLGVPLAPGPKETIIPGPKYEVVPAPKGDRVPVPKEPAHFPPTPKKEEKASPKSDTPKPDGPKLEGRNTRWPPAHQHVGDRPPVTMQPAKLVIDLGTPTATER